MPQLTITTTLKKPDGTPYVNKKVVFTPQLGAFDNNAQWILPVVSVTDQDGVAAIALHANADPYPPSCYTVRLPDGSEFTVSLPQGASEGETFTLGTLRSSQELSQGFECCNDTEDPVDLIKQVMKDVVGQEYFPREEMAMFGRTANRPGGWVRLDEGGRINVELLPLDIQTALPDDNLRISNFARSLPGVPIYQYHPNPEVHKEDGWCSMKDLKDTFPLKADIPAPPDLTPYAKKTDIPESPDLTPYAKKTDIPESPDLTPYAKKTEIPEIPNLDDYAKKADIPESPDLTPYAKKAEIPAPPDLTPYAKKTEIPEIPNLDDYAKKADIPEPPDLTPYAKKTEIPEPPNLDDYAKKIDIPNLDDYAKKTEIPEPPDLTPYAKKTEIPNLDDYAKKADIPAPPNLDDYAKKTDIPTPPNLDDYAKKTDIPAPPNLGDYTKKAEILTDGKIKSSLIPDHPHPGSNGRWEIEDVSSDRIIKGNEHYKVFCVSKTGSSATISFLDPEPADNGNVISVMNMVDQEIILRGTFHPPASKIIGGYGSGITVTAINETWLIEGDYRE
ncbi:MAG: hypothetical protein F6J98_02055 [Moorea sp. SIO4G2]|nr:hypothetical protein [Moorena sp. SIO4G2]